MLTEAQKKIVNGKGLFVVKSCPGSGKTFSVAARIANLFNNPDNDFHFRGIAALSFTNVACDEIKAALQKDFSISVPLKYPHFVGTIDSFINKYIFLPYGHLIMENGKRPVHVGHPYSYWDDFDYSLRKRYKDQKTNKWKISARDPFEYFDKVSFDVNDEPVAIFRTEYFPFSWDKLRKNDGSYKKIIQDIINAKRNKYKEGKATQADANYIALKVLCNYSKITENIINRFTHFIIDEAQDTTDVQMAIIEILENKGAKEIVLIGDPDQAIFEWHNAKPEQFERKYKEWSLSKEYDFEENRRSSKLICNCTRQLLTKVEYAVIGKDKDYDFTPLVIGHNSDDDSVKKCLTRFISICREKNICVENYNIAVLYRSHSTGEWLGIPNPEKYDSPWENGCYYVRDIVQGKYLMDNCELKRGYIILERGYYKYINNVKYCTGEHIKKVIERIGFKEYRNNIFEFIKLLPSTNSTQLTLKEWINCANVSLSNREYGKLLVAQSKSDIFIDDLFKNSKEVKHPDYFIGTIHSTKGKTFEAVLLILSEQAGSSKYQTLLNPKPNKPLSDKQKEELRNVYVAITRPRKILVIAVPESDCDAWKCKLKIN